MRLHALTMALLLCAGAASALTPVETHGALKAKGGKLYGKDGKTVVLRGMSMYWSSEPVGYNFYTGAVVKWLQSDFDVSVIRVPLAVEAPKNSPNYGYTYSTKDSLTNLGRMKNMINACIAQGLYVVVDWHAPEADPYTDYAVPFFTNLATQYKNVPNIIWEVWNEPTLDNNSIQTHANAVIKAIRGVGDTNLVVVGSGNWSSQPDQAPSVTDSKSNVAYTIHFYAGSSAHDSYRDAVSRAISAGRTVFATEWGTSDASGKSNFSSGNSTTWLNFLETNGVSHCNWNIGNPLYNTADATQGVEASAALKSGSSFSGGWDVTGSGTTGLTPSGIYIRSYIRGKNNGIYTIPPEIPDTNALPGTFYATHWSKVSGVDSATSTDTTTKEMISFSKGASADFEVNNSAVTFWNLMYARIKATTAGTMVVKSGSTPLCTLNVAAGSWATLKDTVYLPTGRQALHVDFNFSGNLTFFRFSKMLSAPVGLAARTALQGVRVERGQLILPAGHAFAEVRMMSANGSLLERLPLTAETERAALPAAHGLRWALLVDREGRSSVLPIAPSFE